MTKNTLWIPHTAKKHGHKIQLGISVFPMKIDSIYGDILQYKIQVKDLNRLGKKIHDGQYSEFRISNHLNSKYKNKSFTSKLKSRFQTPYDDMKESVADQWQTLFDNRNHLKFIGHGQAHADGSYHKKAIGLYAILYSNDEKTRIKIYYNLDQCITIEFANKALRFNQNKQIQLHYEVVWESQTI